MNDPVNCWDATGMGPHPWTVPTDNTGWQYDDNTWQSIHDTGGTIGFHPNTVIGASGSGAALVSSVVMHENGHASTAQVVHDAASFINSFLPPGYSVPINAVDVGSSGIFQYGFDEYYGNDSHQNVTEAGQQHSAAGGHAPIDASTSPGFGSCR